MKTCEYCGSRVENGVTFCPHCGASKFKVDEKPSSNLNTYTSQNTYTSHSSQGRYEHHENKAKGESKVLGILSIIFAFFVPIVGFILSIISLAKYKDRSNRRLANTGLIISVIMFIISL